MYKITTFKGSKYKMNSVRCKLKWLTSYVLAMMFSLMYQSSNSSECNLRVNQQRKLLACEQYRYITYQKYQSVNKISTNDTTTHTVKAEAMLLKQ